MKLIRDMAKRFLATRSVAEMSPWAQSWMRGGDVDDSSSRLVAPFSQSAWIYVAITVLGENVAQVPFRISRGRGQGEEILTEGPVVELFRRPHPMMSRAMFWETLVGWEALRGEFFVVPVDANDQPVSLGKRAVEQPVGMLPLNPDYFCHLVQEERLLGWRYNAMRGTSPVREQLLLPEEVIHSRNFNPYLFWRGLSPLSVAMLAASSDYAASQYMKGLMLNNGDAGMVVTTDQLPDERQREQILAALRDRKRRAGTADRPLFLWGGAKVATPTMASADSSLLDHRKLNRQEICSIYKVPESVIGAADQRNSLGGGGAVEQDRLTFIENTICAICHRLEAAMEPVVKSFGADLHGWFDVDSLPVMQAARLQRLTTAQKAFAMGVPFNSINEVYRLGFRPLAWGGKGYIAKGMVVAGEDEARMESGGLRMDGEKAADRILRRQGALEEGQCDAAGKMLALLEGMENEVEVLPGKLRKFLFEQRNRVLARAAEGAAVVFDLEEENRLVVERMKPGAEEEKVRLWELNGRNAASVRSVMEEGITGEELVQRLKGVLG